jgi:hypothetical protein
MTSGIVFYFDVATTIVVSIIMFGFLAYMTGANMARNWRPIGHLVFYCALLAVGERFMAHTIVWHRFYLLLDIFWTDGEWSVAFDAYIFISFVICLTFGFLAYYATRASLMVRQYPWLYERSGPFGWRRR